MLKERSLLARLKKVYAGQKHEEGERRRVTFREVEEAVKAAREELGLEGWLERFAPTEEDVQTKDKGEAGGQSFKR